MQRKRKQVLIHAHVPVNGYVLEQESRKAAEPEKQEYTPRPKSQIILAWILAAVVIFAFLGTCYWMAFYGT